MSQVTAVILAGGKGRRLGGCDKGLLMFQQRPMIERLLHCLQQDIDHIVINANRNQAHYAHYGLPVISDDLADFQGPLAGIATAMTRVKDGSILTLPCDAPFLSRLYVQRMTDDLADNELRVAHDGKRLQPIHALIPTSLQHDLHQFLQSGQRKVSDWYQRHDITVVDFSDQPAIFHNINTAEQLQRLSLKE